MSYSNDDTLKLSAVREHTRFVAKFGQVELAPLKSYSLKLLHKVLK